MNKIALVYPYYDNQNMLEFQLKNWNLYGNEIIKNMMVVIIDDGSPNAPAVDVVRKHLDNIPYPIFIYRIKQDIKWNQHGAKNLAFSLLPSHCMALTSDIDHVLDSEQAQSLFARTYDHENNYYLLGRRNFDGSPYHPHPNTILLSKEAYWKAGGYDEDYCGGNYPNSSVNGCYGGDAEFTKALRGSGYREIINEDIFLYRIDRKDISDASCSGEMREGAQKRGKYYAEFLRRLKEKSALGNTKPQNPLRFDWKFELSTNGHTPAFLT